MRGFAAPVFQNILRHPNADYRLPPVIVLFGRLVVIFVDVSSGESTRASVVLFVYMVLVLLGRLRHSASAVVVSLYMRVLSLIYLLGISRLFFFSAFGENFGPWYAKVRAGPPLSSTHYGLDRPCSAEGKKRSAVLSASAAQPQKVRLGL